MLDGDVYLLAEMDSHMFQVVQHSGEVVDKVDFLSAEALEYQLRKQGKVVEWVDRGAIKERKHVRQLISRFKKCCVMPYFSDSVSVPS